MKLQLRFGKKTERIELIENATLKSLNENVVTCFRLPATSFYVSLNGKDELSGDGSTLLSSFDIVSGDRIFVVERNKGKKEQTTQCKTVSGKHSINSTEDSENRSFSTVNKIIRSSPTNSSESSLSIASHSEYRTSSDPSGTVSSTKSKNQSTSKGSKTTEEKKTDKQKIEMAAVTSSEQFEGIVSEPMLVRDATNDKLPLSLRSVFEKEMPQDEHEVLILICHVLLLETGFNFENSSSERDNSLENDGRTLLSTRTRGSYTLTYSHDYCETLTMSMVCVPMSSMLVVHGKLTGTSGAVTPLQLQSSDYIGQVIQGYPSSWKQLSSLSQMFKDNFAHSILASMRQKLNLPVLYGLLALVPEIQLKILSFLNVHELINLSTVCKHLYSLTNDSTLWKRLVLRDFNIHNTNSSWKITYIQSYRRRLEMERQRRMRIPDHPLQVIPPGFGLVPQYPQPIPNSFPGIRGGDYDLDPFSQGPSSLFNPRGVGSLPNVGPVPGARFDPVNPFRDPSQRPGRGGGFTDNILTNRYQFGGGFF